MPYKMQIRPIYFLQGKRLINQHDAEVHSGNSSNPEAHIYI